MNNHRILPFSSARNFRELGGYPTQDGRRIRLGVLYRGANLDALQSPRDWELLCSLQLKTVLDLRSQKESDAHPDPVIPGAEYLRRCAMFDANGKELDFSPEGILQLYDNMGIPYVEGKPQKNIWPLISGEMPFQNAALQTLFRLLEENRTPLLFHCSAGKDRTGIAAMLVLMALGVPRETALDDYEFTNVCYQEEIRRRIFSRVRRENAEYILDRIFRRYGSMQDYFMHEFGLNALRLAALQNQFLEKV